MLVCWHGCQRSNWCDVSLQEINETLKDALPCYNCTSAWSHSSNLCAECTGFPDYPDRSLLVRALAQGCSEKQRMFQTYHAAPDDVAAARLASAARAFASAFWTCGVSGCAVPNTRFHDGATDSTVSTASRSSSSVASSLW